MSHSKIPSLDGAGADFGAENGERDEPSLKLLRKWPQGEGLGVNLITRGWKRRWGRAAAQNLSANSPRERI